MLGAMTLHLVFSAVLLITVGVSATFYHVHYIALFLRLVALLGSPYPQVDTDYTSDVICVFLRHFSVTLRYVLESAVFTPPT